MTNIEKEVLVRKAVLVKHELDHTQEAMRVSPQANNTLRVWHNYLLEWSFNIMAEIEREGLVGRYEDWLGKSDIANEAIDKVCEGVKATALFTAKYGWTV